MPTLAERRVVMDRLGVAAVTRLAAQVVGDGVGGGVGGDQAVMDVLADPRVYCRAVVQLGGAGSVLATAGQRIPWTASEAGAKQSTGVESGGAAGGGGGGAGPRSDTRANARVLLCAWPTDRRPDSILTRPTADPCDRAHLMRNSADIDRVHGERLYRGDKVMSASVPRRYPGCQFNLRGLAVDSFYDDLYERQCRLDREFGGVAGISYERGGRESAGSLSGSEMVARSLAEGFIRTRGRAPTTGEVQRWDRRNWRATHAGGAAVDDGGGER